MLSLPRCGPEKPPGGCSSNASGTTSAPPTIAGINSRAVKFIVYTFSGLCAGLAGLLAASNIKGADSDHAGLFLELDAIVAVVVGGTALTGGRFYLAGSIVGALIIQTLTTTMYAQGVSSDVAPVPKALGDFGSLPAAIARCSAGRSSGCRRSLGLWRGGRHETSTEIHSAAGDDLVFVVLYTFGCVRYDNFGSLRVAVNLLGDNGFLGVAAVGATFVILSGGIDLSVGAVVAATSILIARLIESACHPLAAIAIALAVGACFGAAWALDSFLQAAAVYDHAGRHVSGAGLGFVVRRSRWELSTRFTSTRSTKLSRFR